MKILCITPVKHLDGVYEKLKSCGEVIYEPNITKQKLKILLAIIVRHKILLVES